MGRHFRRQIWRNTRLIKTYTEPMAESRTDGEPPLIWVLVDERAGTAAQSLGVAEVLGLPFESKPINFSKSAKLPNLVLGASRAGLDRPSQATLVPPWPDLVIGAGRRSAPVARWIKRQADGPVFLAHVMFPGRVGVEDFDFIAVPRHDGHLPRPNQFEITGAPHGVTADVLSAAAAAWQRQIDAAPQPRVGLLVGGATRRRKYDDATASELGRLAADMTARAGGSLLVTTSRRTGQAADALLEGITGTGLTPEIFHRWNDPGENPYRGILAISESIIVTGDSVSMCTEACATEASVYIYAPPGTVTAKHARFHQELYERGYAQPFPGASSPLPHDRLNAANDIASEIRQRMGL